MNKKYFLNLKKEVLFFGNSFGKVKICSFYPRPVFNASPAKTKEPLVFKQSLV